MVRFDLQEGLTYNPAQLSQCRCEHIEGCWEGAAGECRLKCPTDRCDNVTRECSKASNKRAFPLDLWILVLVLAVSS
jgi:hypothetical protein